MARVSVAPTQARTVSPAAEAFVASIRSLPLFSNTALLVLQSVGKDEVSTQELARLIAADAGLTLGLLRTVNSPFYGLPSRVAAVPDAIKVLGLNQVRRTVLAAVSQWPLAEHLKNSRVVRHFWRRLLLTAALSRHVTLRNGLDGDVAYTAGLMHGVGRLRCSCITRPCRICHRTSGPSTTDSASNASGPTSDSITRRSAWRCWRTGDCPAAIVAAAHAHGDDTLPADPLSAAVRRANLLAHDLFEEADDDVERPWMVAVGLTVAERRRLVGEIAALEGAG